MIPISQLHLQNLPPELSACSQWICWRYEWRGGKLTKVPYDPRTNAHAGPSNPHTWVTVNEAIATYEKSQTINRPYSGIGFVLTNTEFVAFDIDNCRDPSNGWIDDEVIRIVECAGSYTEITPSGKGLRIIGFGAGETVHRIQKLNATVNIETYRRATRYIAVTGNCIFGKRLANLDRLIDEMVGFLDHVNQTTRYTSQPSDTPTPGGCGDISPSLFANIEFNKVGERSEVFYYVVGRLRELRWSIDDIERLLNQHPDGVAQRYIQSHRLRREIERCFGKTDAPHKISQWQKGSPLRLNFNARTVPPYRR